MKKIAAIGIAPIAKQELDKCKKLSIHSRFNNSMNLLSGTHLIYLGERALPFGLQIKNFDDIRDTEMVFYENNQLIFMNQGIKRYIQINEVPLIDDLHKGILNCPKDKYKYLKEFVELKNLEPLTYYLGRGPGLTPSGDDLLVGLYCISFCNLEIKNLIKNLNGIHFKDYTTSVSAEYLDAARKGRFNPDLIQLLNCEKKDEFIEKANNILKIGHSSGMDTLEGILLGLDIIDKETHYENENCRSFGW